MRANPGEAAAESDALPVEVSARSPVAQCHRITRSAAGTVAFAETRVFVEGDSEALIPIAIELLRRPWGGVQGGWWSGASTTYVDPAPAPATQTPFAFDFNPFFFPAPIWIRAIAGGIVGALWGLPGAAIGAVAGALLLPRVFSPTLIRVSVGGVEQMPEGVRLPVELSHDFSGTAVLSVKRVAGGIELRSAWLEVRCNKALPSTFAVGLHLWRERAVLLRAKALCERQLAALTAPAQNS